MWTSVSPWLRVRDLGMVFQLVGSTCGVLVICVVPALLLLQPGVRDGGGALGGSAGGGGGVGGGGGGGGSGGVSGVGGEEGGDGGDGGGGLGWEEGEAEDDDRVSEMAFSGELGRARGVFRGMTHDDMRAALLGDIGGDGGNGDEDAVTLHVRRGKAAGRHRVSAADAVRAYLLLALAVLIATSNVYVLLFAKKHRPRELP